MESNKGDLRYTLSERNIIVLSIYYIFILLVGLIITVLILINLDNDSSKNLLGNTVLASISASGMLCSIQYLKKLYKACLEKRVDCTDGIAKYGNILYFFSRPIFAFVFVIITIFALLSGMIIITSSIDYVLNNRFLYLCVIVSSFIGYSIGRVLDKFGSLSQKKIDKALE